MFGFWKFSNGVVSRKAVRICSPALFLELPYFQSSNERTDVPPDGHSKLGSVLFGIHSWMELVYLPQLLQLSLYVCNKPHSIVLHFCVGAAVLTTFDKLARDCGMCSSNHLNWKVFGGTRVGRILWQLLGQSLQLLLRLSWRLHFPVGVIIRGASSVFRWMASL
jgi:hypothetical protein